jgi:hypothetical protein
MYNSAKALNHRAVTEAIQCFVVQILIAWYFKFTFTVLGGSHA